MAKQVTRDRRLTPEEAAKYRQIREAVEQEKPEIIAKAQQARREARRTSSGNRCRAEPVASSMAAAIGGLLSSSKTPACTAASQRCSKSEFADSRNVPKSANKDSTCPAVKGGLSVEAGVIAVKARYSNTTPPVAAKRNANIPRTTTSAKPPLDLAGGATFIGFGGWIGVAGRFLTGGSVAIEPAAPKGEEGA